MALGRREAIVLNSFIDQIWHKYDIDGSNSICVEETKQMLIDISGHKRVNKRECKAFVKHVENLYLDPGEAPSESIQKEHLTWFIEGGIAMEERERKNYAKRGNFQKMLIDFFNGFEAAIHPYMEIEQQKLLDYFDEIWHKYDVDGSNTISVQETKQLLEDMTGRGNITVKECKQFVAWLIRNSEEPATSSGAIDNIHFMDFVDEFLSMSTDQREEYATRGTFHKILYDFIVGIEDGLDKYQPKQKKSKKKASKKNVNVKKVTTRGTKNKNVNNKKANLAKNAKSKRNMKQKNRGSKNGGDIKKELNQNKLVSNDENRSEKNQNDNNVQDKPGYNNNGNRIEEIESKEGYIDVLEDNTTAEMIEVKLDPDDISNNAENEETYNSFGRWCFFNTVEEVVVDDENDKTENNQNSEARTNSNIQEDKAKGEKDREGEEEKEGEEEAEEGEEVDVLEDNATAEMKEKKGEEEAEEGAEVEEDAKPGDPVLGTVLSVMLVIGLL